MSDSPDILENDKFLRREEVVRQTGLSAPTIYRLIARDLFPKSRRYIGVAGSFWLQSEVRCWQQQQLSGMAA